MRVHLHRAIVVEHANAEVRGGQRGELMLHHRGLATVLLASHDPPKEGGHRILDGDHGRLSAYGLAVQVEEQQPGLRTIGKARPDVLARCGVKHSAGLDLEPRLTLTPVPYDRLRIRPRGRQGALTHYAVLERQLLGPTCRDLACCVEQSASHRRERPRATPALLEAGN